MHNPGGTFGTRHPGLKFVRHRMRSIHSAESLRNDATGHISSLRTRFTAGVGQPPWNSRPRQRHHFAAEMEASLHPTRHFPSGSGSE